MKLKKINEELQQALIENGLTEANDAKETFSTLKSGSDCIIIAPKEREINNNCAKCNSEIGRRNRRITKGFDYC
jgi:3-dehydroquinate synthase class II